MEEILSKYGFFIIMGFLLIPACFFYFDRKRIRKIRLQEKKEREEELERIKKSMYDDVE